MQEMHAPPQPFQDCVYFREGLFRVLGQAVEDKTTRPGAKASSMKYPAVVLAIQGFGLVRVAATMRQDAVEDIAEPKVTAKSKLEQAVFFGHLPETPLNLFDAHGQTFSSEETEKAALELSREILSSQSRFVRETTTVNMQLKMRSKALQDLASHLSEHGPPISRSARWKLLQGAEKLAAQQAMWKVEEEHMKHRRYEDKTLLDRILFYIVEQALSVTNPEKGEHDQVRQWFKYDTWRIEHVVPWFCNVMVELRKDRMKDHQSTTTQISDGIELCLAALPTAFRFRENNAPLYGFEDDAFENGIRTSSYANLLEPWTSTRRSYEQMQKLLHIALEFCDTHRNDSESDREIMEKIRHNLAPLCMVVNQMALEYGRWAADQPDEQVRANGEKLYNKQLDLSREQMLRLVRLELSGEALQLAEDLSDMDSLVAVLYAQSVQLYADAEQRHATIEELQADKEMIEGLEEGYLRKYGDRFASAYYSSMVTGSQLGHMLDDSNKRNHERYMTNFLRKHPGYAKIGWIQGVTSREDYPDSADLLEKAAGRESDLWSKKVELCLSKLAHLATAEAVDADRSPDLKRFDRQITLIDIQETLYLHVIMHANLVGAIDREAEVELTLQTFGQTTARTKAFRSSLEHTLATLLGRGPLRIEQVIDLLTLIDPAATIDLDESEIVGHEFFLALRVLHESGLGDGDNMKAKAEALERMIWRRCMIRDDWGALNNTDMKDDSTVAAQIEGTALYMTLRECFEAGKQFRVW